MIKSNELKFKYDEQLVLNNISVKIEKGEYICIIGASGSGKSTFALQLNGILTPSSGTVYIDNIDTTSQETIFEIRKNVGIVFQNPDNQIISSIVEEDVAFGPSNIGQNAEIDKVLQDVGLSEYRNHSTTKLSGGQKQRLALAGVLAMKPEYLILDESTSMLDKQSSKKILEIIRQLNNKYGITIIHITHTMEEAVSADRVIVFHNGQIVLDDIPAQVFKNVELLENINLSLPLPIKLAYELGVDVPNEVLTSDDLVDAIVKEYNNICR